MDGLSNLLAQAEDTIQNILYAPGLIFALAEDGGQTEPPLFLMRETGVKYSRFCRISDVESAKVV